MFSGLDHAMMAQALQLAQQGLYTTSPNPRVGCVIVKDGVIVGQGAHLKAGEPHAEVYALQQAGNQAQGADAYVTLEPCSHFGKTPPCADALIKAGIRRVVAAMEDPNPQVAGSGLARLHAHGIEVASGLMQAQAEELNRGFISRMTSQRPFVRSKVAASLDGRTALANGESKWITGDAARLDVQHWRARSCAILTGIGTVLADDPKMNVRDIDTPRQPLRVVIDSKLNIPLTAKILQGGNTLVVYASADNQKIASLQKLGTQTIELSDGSGKVCLKRVLSHLAQMQINEVIVEAGQTLNGALLAQDLVDELLIYYAPVLLGADAKGMFDIPILNTMAQRTKLDILDVRQVGQDIRLRAKPQSD